jgi:hypothetical protein
MTTHTSAAGGPGARTAGVVLIATSLLSVLLMAHHPSAASHDTAGIAAEIAGKAPLSRFVHGALIAMIGAQIFAFVEFCRRIGLGDGAVRAGFIGYALGACAMIGAALISGFLVSDLSEHYRSLAAGELDAYRHLLRFAMAANQTLAKFGVVAMSAGIVSWSIAIVRGSRAPRWLGALGFVAGLAPAVALAIGVLALDVHGMLLVVVCQTAWNIAAGVYLIRFAP